MDEDWPGYLIDHWPPFEVLREGEPVTTSECDLAVVFNDVASHFFESDVGESVRLLAQVGGVERVLHEDRELVLLWGADAAPEQVAGMLEWQWRRIVRREP